MKETNPQSLPEQGWGNVRGEVDCPGSVTVSGSSPYGFVKA